MMRKDSSARMAALVGSSEGIRRKSIFMYVDKTMSSKRGCTTSITTGNTTTIIMRGSIRIPRGIAMVGMRSAHCTLTLVSTTCFKCPTSGVGIVNVAKAGKGAAAACVVGSVLRRAKRGIKLVKAVRTVVKSGGVPSYGAAPRSCAVRGCFTRVMRTNYSYIIVRISSRKLVLREATKVPFRVNVFAGLKESRVKPGRRGSFSSCGEYGNLLFGRYGLKVTGISSGCFGSMFRKSAYGVRAFKFSPRTSLHTRGMRLMSEPKCLNITCRITNIVSFSIRVSIPNGFDICGSLATVSIYHRFRMPIRVVGSTLGGTGMGKHVRVVGISSSFALVVSCTRGTVDLRDLLAALGRCGPGHLMYLFKYNKGHSGSEEFRVNRMSKELTSLAVVASSGPEFRRPRSVVGSVGAKVTGASKGCIRVYSHGRTVGCTVRRNRPKSIVMLTKGKRRSCRRVYNIGRPVSRHILVGRILRRLGRGWSYIYEYCYECAA